MTDLEKELREFLAAEFKKYKEHYAYIDCDVAYYDGMADAFERVIEWLDGDR